MDRQRVEAFLGKPLDGLQLAERLSLNGCWVATELYSPETLPLRIMEAIGFDARECVEQLRRKGLDPARYHYEALGAPFEPHP